MGRLVVGQRRGPGIGQRPGGVKADEIGRRRPVELDDPALRPSGDEQKCAELQYQQDDCGGADPSSVEPGAAHAASVSMTCSAAGTGERVALMSRTLMKKPLDAVWNPSRISVPDGMTRRIAAVAANAPKSSVPHTPTA